MTNKKFSIIQKIDLDKLNNEIENFISISKETNPYLFMSKNTFNAIPITDDSLHQFGQINAIISGTLGYYCGYKVFEDNSLEFGEVEIR